LQASHFREIKGTIKRRDSEVKRKRRKKI